MIVRAGQRELGLLRTLLVALLILAIPVALITTTIRVAISEQALYDYSVREYDAERISGIPESELIRANGLIRGYLTDSDPGPLSPQVQNVAGETVPLFNAKETVHMADVRNLVQLMFTVQVIAVGLVLGLAALMIILWPARVLAVALLFGSLITGAILGAVGIFAMMGFDSAWTDFHEVAFTNDFWSLNPRTDHLIQMYPEEFWFEATTLIWIGIMVQTFTIAAFSSAYLFVTRERVNTDAKPPLELPGRAGHARLSPPEPRHFVR